jgi:DNA-binding transcriptional LysR family regulator
VKSYPAVEVVLEISLSEKINTGILSNKLDVGLVTHRAKDPRLLSQEFMSDQLVAISPVNHRWAAQQRIAPQDLLGETFIVAAPMRWDASNPGRATPREGTSPTKK